MNGLFEGFVSDLGVGGGYVTEAEIAEEMERLELMESADMDADDPVEACYEAMVANERNYSKLLLSVAHEEFDYFVRNGEEMVYEGARISAFLDKCKDLLDKAWQKIKSIFEKAVAHLNSWISSDKRFVDKFKDKILNAGTNARTLGDVYDIQIKALGADYYAVMAKKMSGIALVTNRGRAKDYVDTKVVDNRMGDGGKIVDFEIKKIDSEALDSALFGSKTMEEYVDSIKKALGLKKKEPSLTFSGEQVIAELKAGKTSKNNVKIMYNDAKKCVAGIKKSVDEAKREASKDSDVSSASFSVVGKACNRCISAMNKIQSVQLQAVNHYHKNCRKVAARAVSGSIKESFDEYGSASSFANILE